MTFEAFKAAVQNLLGTDKQRLGATDFMTGQLRAAVLDIIDKVPFYRQGLSTIIQSGDLDEDGSAQLGEFPADALITEAYVIRSTTTPPDVDDEDVVRHPCLDDVAWEDRYALINGLVPVSDNNARICLSPDGTEFYLYPMISEDEVDDDERYSALQLFYDSDALPTDDDDETPYDERMALCVADWLKAKLALHVEKNEGLHDRFMADYALKRRNLRVRGDRKGRLQD